MMRGFRLIIYVVFVLVSLSYSACRKEPVYPQLEFVDQQDFNLAYQDTLTFRFNVSDYSHGISVKVLDGDKILPFTISSVSERNGSFVYMLYCNDRYVESGSYDLRISAENDEVGSSRFGTLAFTGLQKSISGVAYLTASGAAQYYNMSTGITTPLSLGKTYQEITFNSDYQRLFLIQDDLNLDVLNVLNPSDIASINLSISPNLGFENLYTQDLKTFNLPKQSTFEEIGQSANRIASYTLPTDVYAIDISLTASSVYSFCRDRNNPTTNTSLIRFNRVSKQQIGQVSFFGEPIAVEAIDEDQVLVLYKRGGLRNLYRFNASDQSLTKVFETSSNFSGLFVFHTSMGFVYGADGLFSFDPSVSGQPAGKNLLPISSLEYDPVSEQFLVASNQALTWLDPQSGSGNVLLQSNTPITAFSIVYNK